MRDKTHLLSSYLVNQSIFMGADSEGDPSCHPMAICNLMDIHG